jgi:signal peptidase complex subunit 3
MHSALVRAQNVFGFFTTVAFAVAALIAASDLIATRTPSAVVTVDKVQVYACYPAVPFLFQRRIPSFH